MDARHPPAGLALPPWITEYVAQNEQHRALVLLRDPQYIGGGHSLPLAHQNGQSFVPMDVPPAQALKMRDFPRFTPPSRGHCPEVVWRDSIGPGHAWSPKPHFSFKITQICQRPPKNRRTWKLSFEAVPLDQVPCCACVCLCVSER